MRLTLSQLTAWLACAHCEWILYTWITWINRIRSFYFDSLIKYDEKQLCTRNGNEVTSEWLAQGAGRKWFTRSLHAKFQKVMKKFSWFQPKEFEWYLKRRWKCINDTFVARVSIFTIIFSSDCSLSLQVYMKRAVIFWAINIF